MLHKTDKLLFFYENLVNWKARLSKEGSFLTDLFNKHNAVNILDCGCGIGKHVFFLRGNGFDAHGSDLNPKHIDRARELADGASDSVSFFLEDMTELPLQADSSRDAVMSLGNTLSAMGYDNVTKAFSAFFRVLKPQGVFVGQILNFGSLSQGDRTEVRSALVDGKEVVYVKTFHCESDFYLVITNVLSRETLDIIDNENPDKNWDCLVESTKMYGLKKEFIEKNLFDAGFDDIEFFGSLKGDAFDEEHSKDMVFVAKKK